MRAAEFTWSMATFLCDLPALSETGRGSRKASPLSLPTVAGELSGSVAIVA